MKITIDLPVQQLDDIQYWLGAQEIGDTQRIIHNYDLEFTQDREDMLEDALCELYSQIRKQILEELNNAEGRIFNE